MGCVAGVRPRGDDEKSVSGSVRYRVPLSETRNVVLFWGWKGKLKIVPGRLFVEILEREGFDWGGRRPRLITMLAKAPAGPWTTRVARYLYGVLTYLRYVELAVFRRSPGTRPTTVSAKEKLLYAPSPDLPMERRVSRSPFLAEAH